MTRSLTTVQVRPLHKEIFNIPEQRPRVFDSPKPSFILAALRPRIRSHMYSVLSFPTLSATFPDGCTDTELTRPLWPFSDRSTAQSRARKTQRVPSSDAEMRCEREGKVRCVIEPEKTRQVHVHVKQERGDAKNPPSCCMSPPTSFRRLRSQTLMISSPLPDASHFPPCGDAATDLMCETWAGKIKIGFNVHSSSVAADEETDTIPSRP